MGSSLGNFWTHGYIEIHITILMKRFKHTNEEIQEAIKKTKEKEQLKQEDES